MAALVGDSHRFGGLGAGQRSGRAHVQGSGRRDGVRGRHGRGGEVVLSGNGPWWERLGPIAVGQGLYGGTLGLVEGGLRGCGGAGVDRYRVPVVVPPHGPGRVMLVYGMVPWRWLAGAVCRRAVSHLGLRRLECVVVVLRSRVR
jgi:hypothetical protein